jgi:tRNA dimethylallyltransferase
MVFVGGTGLYGRAVVDQLEIPPQFPELRRDLEARATEHPDALFDELRQLDPLAASRTAASNTRRVVRALEVTKGSGRPFSSFGPGLRDYPASPSRQVGLRVATDLLDERLEQRFRRWMDEGLLEEVIGLSERSRGLSRTARQAVGYRELLRHVDEGLDLDSAINDAVSATRRLARRQMSWFQRDPRIEWFDAEIVARRRLRDLLAGSHTLVGD